MDEHIKLSSGKTIQFENDIVDHNLNNLTWWTEKHNNYATREAVDILNINLVQVKRRNVLTIIDVRTQSGKRLLAQIELSQLGILRN